MGMDKFKINLKPAPVPEQFDFEEQGLEKKKLFEVAQFPCLPRHVGMAIALKNYWSYRYDSISK